VAALIGVIAVAAVAVVASLLFLRDYVRRTAGAEGTPATEHPQPVSGLLVPVVNSVSKDEERGIVADLANPARASAALKRCLALPPLEPMVQAVDASPAMATEIEAVLARWAEDTSDAGPAGDAGVRLCRRWLEATGADEARMRPRVRALPSCIAAVLAKPEPAAQSLGEREGRGLALILRGPRPAAARAYLAAMTRNTHAAPGLRRFACRHLAQLGTGDEPTLAIAVADPACTAIAVPALLADGHIEAVLTALRTPATAAPATTAIGRLRADVAIPPAIDSALLTLLTSTDPWAQVAALPALARATRGHPDRRSVAARAVIPAVLSGFRMPISSDGMLAALAIEALWRMEPSAGDLQPFANALNFVLCEAMRKEPRYLPNTHLLEEIGPLLARAGVAIPEAAAAARAALSGVSDPTSDQNFGLPVIIACALVDDHNLALARRMARATGYRTRTSAIHSLGLYGKAGVDAILEELKAPGSDDTRQVTIPAISKALLRHCRIDPRQTTHVVDRLLDLFDDPALGPEALINVSSIVYEMCPVAANHLAQTLSLRSQAPGWRGPTAKKFGLLEWTAPFVAVEDPPRCSIDSLWPVLWPRRQDIVAKAALLKALRDDIDADGSSRCHEPAFRLALHDDAMIARIISLAPQSAVMPFVAWLTPLRDDAAEAMARVRANLAKSLWDSMEYRRLPMLSQGRLPASEREAGLRRLKRIGAPDPDAAFLRQRTPIPELKVNYNLHMASIQQDHRDAADVRIADDPVATALPRIAAMAVVERRTVGLLAALRFGENALPLVESIQVIVDRWDDRTTFGDRPWHSWPGDGLGLHPFGPPFLAEEFLIRMAALEPTLPTLP